MSRQILGKKGYHLVISKEKQCRSLKRTGFRGSGRLARVVGALRRAQRALREAPSRPAGAPRSPACAREGEASLGLAHGAAAERRKTKNHLLSCSQLGNFARRWSKLSN